MISGTCASIKQRKSELVHAVQDEVNWDPETTKASWSCIGVDWKNKLFLLHIFGDKENSPKISDLNNFLTYIGTKDAILLGGSADVQQYFVGDKPQFMQAKARIGSETKDKAAKDGFRDLGAAILVFRKVKE